MPTGTPASRLPSPLALFSALVTVYLVWGSTFLGMKIALEGFPPLVMGALRFLIAGSVLSLLLAVRIRMKWGREVAVAGGDAKRAACSRREEWRNNALIGTFLFLGGNGGVAWAAQFLPSGLVSLIVSITPLFIVLIEWAWPGGQRPTLLIFAALALGMTGTVWLTAPWESAHVAGGAVPLVYVVAILLCSVCWALGSICARHLRNSPSVLRAASQQMLCGGLGLGLAAWALGDLARFEPRAVSLHAWGAFFHISLAGSLVAFSTYAWLMRNVPPALAATTAYVNPIVALFLGWLILDEAVSERTFVAAGLILCSVVIISITKARASR